MTYYDKVINPLFKSIDESTSIFYSTGKLSKGYVVDRKTEQQIKGFLKSSLKLSIICIIVLVIIHKFLPLLYLAIYTPFYFMKMSNLLKKSKKVN